MGILLMHQMAPQNQIVNSGDCTWGKLNSFIQNEITQTKGS
jgi:hypothetical protein